MSLKKPDELRQMQPEERDIRLKELRSELMNERGVASMGGQPTSPGRMRALKKQIARLTTIMREIELESEN
ncbi:MAG: 50S ribosomal protein L29 [Euryarchaeota archaeon]|jgi:large subunit ribosomal protein L29|uniref:Large ribosomal subunit protein uL29 n=1 Tax=Marine Group III euryarchaeote CG-Epi2 TaxID=1888996 RepID=A0A1J5TLI6_9ARCH|nr:50S ribosomal protein L29 [Euryarchaeota archaeon]MDG1543884.1 50S ribosomal protein L29 [archaeon]OIR21826.1 MAG: 50S ribosomal protein L29 [Marine Group III euryarchaeote CG-Epi2]|tara:strand:- start:1295 stop:1507 length:213 start_codon:yes stop_codon:yes gene_type:complete